MKYVLIALMLLTAGVAHAGERIAVMVSKPGADKIAFLTEVGDKLRAFSNHTGFEACAGIATDGARFGVAIVTSGSHIGCSIDTHDVPTGMHYIGETIHSHPRPTRFYANKADMQFIGHTGSQTVNVARMSTDDFSDGDYVVPGYLAGRRGLYYQNGKGTATQVSTR